MSVNLNDTVSYAQTRLTYDATVPRLFGDAVQFFNDRRSGLQPFDKGQTDPLGIALMIENRQVKMALTLKRWGNVVGTVWPVCLGSFLLAPTGTGDGVYVVHLKR